MTDSPDTRRHRTVCPGGQPIYALQCAVDTKGKTICYAATGAGLYVCTEPEAEAVTAWHPLFADPVPSRPLSVTAVAVCPPPHPLDGLILAGSNGSILRSTDRGATWQVTRVPSPPPLVVALASSTDFEEAAVVFAATAEDGVFRSSDGGRNWVAWNFGLLDLNLFCLAVSPDYASDQTLFVGAESGVYRSTNGARAWRELEFPAEAAPVLSLAISPNFASDGALWAGSEMGGLYVSRNEGETWCCILSGEVGAINGLVAANNPAGGVSVLLLSSAGIRRSHDGGETWQDLSCLLDSESDATCLASEPGQLEPGTLTFVGLVDGSVMTIPLPDYS